MYNASFCAPCRTDAFVWCLAPLDQRGTSNYSATSVQAIPHDDARSDEVRALRDDTGRLESGGSIVYMGSMPDLQSSEITAISYRSPLLATGLGTGKIYLWRCGDLRACLALTYRPIRIPNIALEPSPPMI